MKTHSHTAWKRPSFHHKAGIQPCPPIDRLFFITNEHQNLKLIRSDYNDLMAVLRRT